MKKGLGFIFVFCVFLSSNAMADSFRCGQSLVKEGDSSNTLLKKCGNPERKYSTYTEINQGGRRYNTGVVNWVYERTGKKDMLVSVQNGQIVKIDPD